MNDVATRLKEWVLRPNSDRDWSTSTDTITTWISPSETVATTSISEPRNGVIRWYDPVTGRFLSNDPIGISGGVNQYVFCASIRVPPGKNLAHRRGFEASKGYGYEHSDLQDIDLHQLQHGIEGY